MVLSKRKIKRNLFIIISSSVGMYLLISFYFFGNFLFRTEINGINVSLRAHKNLPKIISECIYEYKLLLIERDGETEFITGHDINLRYNNTYPLSKINDMQNPFKWINSLFKINRYYIKDLFTYDNMLLDNKINRLKCLNRKITEPRNADFEYSSGSYKIVKEIYGNKINKSRLKKLIAEYIAEGRRTLDLNMLDCYENPKYKANSEKTLRTKNLLDKYVSAEVTYLFGNVKEQLDGSVIHKWLSVDENLDVVISYEDAAAYINALSQKYDTVGIKRTFLTSTGKTVELQGGLYGWKIDKDAETKALIDNIKQGERIEKEPIYLQRAYSREGNEIGDIYIEINITKQHLWFYKDGKMIVQGPVVTGNPNRGHATVPGVYMINYKQKNATLTGPGYEAKVTYWMPFFGNIGLHDAPWRNRFGENIYLTNGSHGCVNAPLYLAGTVFENIEEGTPVVVYEEK